MKTLVLMPNISNMRFAGRTRNKLAHTISLASRHDIIINAARSCHSIAAAIIFYIITIDATLGIQNFQ